MKSFLLAALLLIPLIAQADVIVVVKDNYRAPSEIVVFNGVCLASAFTKRFSDSSEGGRVECYSKELILYKTIKCNVRITEFWAGKKTLECK